jgi:hypothetical protein
MKKNKDFDCVEMMHEGQAEVTKKLAGMSPQERRQYWHKKTEELHILQRQIRQESHAAQG